MSTLTADGISHVSADAYLKAMNKHGTFGSACEDNNTYVALINYICSCTPVSRSTLQASLKVPEKFKEVLQDSETEGKG